MRRLRWPSLIAVLLLPAHVARAQLPDYVPPPQDAPDRLSSAFGGQPNVVSVGFGAVTGVLGARYVRHLSTGPVGLGLGVGAMGLSPHVELAFPGGGLVFHRGLIETFVSLDALVGYGRSFQRTGSIVLEVGERSWAARERWFFEFGIGFVRPVWGNPQLGLGGVVFPRLQVGIAF